MSIALAKKIIKGLGINTDVALSPYYLIPCLLFKGKALPPLRAVFEITFRCNLACQMCPLANWKNDSSAEEIREAMGNELTTPQIKNFIDQLKALKTRALMVTGGEPFLRKDILDVLEYVKRSGLYCTVISNGTLIDREKAGLLVKIGVDVVAFSLDGPRDIHNSIRGSGDSFTKIYNAIDQIQAAKGQSKNPLINLNFTISALNQDHLDAMVDIALDLKINLINFIYLFYSSDHLLEKSSQMLNMGRLKPENQVIDEKIKQIDIRRLNQSIKRAREKARKHKLTLNFRPPLKGREIEKRFFDPSYSYCTKCFYPWFETRIDPSGNVYPCSIDVPMGNVAREQLSDIWNGKRYRDFRNTLRKNKLLPACAKCCKLNCKFWSYLPT